MEQILSNITLGDLWALILLSSAVQTTVLGLIYGRLR